MWSSASLTAYNPYAHDADTYIPNEKVNLQSSNESIADTERNVKVEGTTNSKIPSIFDHVVRNSSTIESNYQEFAIIIPTVPIPHIPFTDLPAYKSHAALVQHAITHGVFPRIPARLQQILTVRYGLDGGSKKTLEETGVQLNLSRERVRQLEDRALRWLTSLLKRREPRL
jgi:Sigma-70, region 4